MTGLGNSERPTGGRVGQILTLGLILATYAVWGSAGEFWHSQYWWLAVVAMAICAAFHGSLQHETIHGHPTRFGWLNEALVSLPLIGIFPYRRYRELHLKHHNDMCLTDPYEDPESFYFPLSHYRAMRPLMRFLFAANNTFVGRLILGPWLTLYGFLRTEFARLVLNEKGVRLAWVFHAAGLVLMGWIITRVFTMPLWAYALLVTYPALAITSIRAYAEHQAAENVGARSAVVETGKVMALLYLNNNLHIVHHASPATPWYDLPRLYRERRDQYLAANGHYLFFGYFEVARRFAFRAKEQVDHPFLYRDGDAEG